MSSIGSGTTGNSSIHSFDGLLPVACRPGFSASLPLKLAVLTASSMDNSWTVSPVAQSVFGLINNGTTANSDQPNGWTFTSFAVDGGSSFSEDGGFTFKYPSASVTVGVPIGATLGLYLVTYRDTAGFSGVYNALLSVSLTAGTGIAAPTVYNITAESAQFDAPTPLVTGFASYRPEFYDPLAAMWRSAGANLLAGETATASFLEPDTGGYKARFVGIPATGYGDAESEGAESAEFTTLAAPEPTVCSMHALGKDISTAYKAHLDNSVTTRAFLYKLKRRDGVTLGFTGHDRDIDGDSITRGGVAVPECVGVLFESSTGISPTGLQSKLSMDQDNMEIMSALTSDAITEADLNAGVYDFAEVWVMECNYADLTQGILAYKYGRIGRIFFDGMTFRAETNSLSELTENKVVEETSLLCRAKKFGDARCKKNLAGNSVDGFAITINGTIDSVDSGKPDRKFTSSQVNGYPVNRLTYGWMKITDAGSDNYNLERPVRSNTGSGEVELDEPFPYPLAAGDTFQAICGCPRRIRDCWETYDNAVNFQGEPYIPGVSVYDINRA
jgi:uncharacterized phage protein (TIGR02218 family)